jgi:DNA-directed RNA polymerase specialized sigma24 family protein
MDGGSVTRWIGQVKQGGESVAEGELWQRYFTRLAALARKRLDDLPPHARDEEDLALSVLKSLFLRAREGQFPELHDRTDLWQLLAKITVRKSIDRRRMAKAQKRGSGQVQSEPEYTENLKELASQEPPPEILVAMQEECDRLLSVLDDDLRHIASLKLEGYSNSEIAAKLGRVERTVERKLERIRHAWLKELEPS